METVSTIEDDDPELVRDLEQEACLSSEDRLLLETKDGAGDECKPESGLQDRLQEMDEGQSLSAEDAFDDNRVDLEPEVDESLPEPSNKGRAGEEAAFMLRLRRLGASAETTLSSFVRKMRGFDHALAGSRVERLFPFCLEGLSGLLNGLLLLG